LSVWPGELKGGGDGEEVQYQTSTPSPSPPTTSTQPTPWIPSSPPTSNTTSYNIFTASSLGEEGRGVTPPTTTTINSIIHPGKYYIPRSYFSRILHIKILQIYKSYKNSTLQLDKPTKPTSTFFLNYKPAASQHQPQHHRY